VFEKLEWTVHTVESGGEDIYFEITSGASTTDTIVLCHGGSGSHAMWFQQVPVLAEGRRVITWDTRGWGCSTLRTGRVDTSTVAEDLARVLDSAGVHESVHMAAQSLGGWWMTAFALKFPGRVQSLTYTSTTGGLFTPALDDHFRRVMSVRSDSPTWLGHHPLLGSVLPEKNPAHAFLYQQLITLQPPVPANKATEERFPLDKLAELAIPTLCIVGEEDHIFPPDLYREVAAAIGAQFTTIAGAGHSPFFETPDEWNKTFLSFIDGVSAD
jgi:pimeloyl-ACP methyl ester carboxylesterase